MIGKNYDSRDKSTGRILQKGVSWIYCVYHVYWELILGFDGVHVMNKWNATKAKAHLRGEGGESCRTLGTASNPYPCAHIPDAIKAAIPAPKHNRKK